MATINNDNILKRIEYIQDTLTYSNIPIIVFTVVDNVATRTDVIRIQGYRLDNTDSALPLEERIRVKVGNELIETVDFTVDINNTNDGINITFFNNLEEVEEIRITRYTEPSLLNDYIENTTSSTLRNSLENDINKLGNIAQEHEKRLNDTETETGKYSTEIAKRKVFTVHGREGDVVSENGDYTASQIDYIPNTGIDATNLQDGLTELKEDIDSVRQGITNREQCRVATIANIPDFNNVNTVDGESLNLFDRVLVKDQTNKAENGIYWYSSLNTLTRTNDADTLAKIAVTHLQVVSGTSENLEFHCIVANTQTGVLGIEPVIVEKEFNSIAEDQITNLNLAKVPANTYKGNETGVTADPLDIPTKTAFNKDYSVLASDIKMNGVQSLGLLDTLARTDHIHPSDITKANQVDLDTTNASIVTLATETTNSLDEKQDTLAIGGDSDYIGFNNGNIENKTFASETVGLGNVDNTSDSNKPISVPQQEEFDKSFRYLGNITAYLSTGDLNDTTAFLNGSYFILNDLTATILNAPAGVNKTTDALFKVINYYDSLQEKFIEQYYIDTDAFIAYKRYYSFDIQAFTSWDSIATGTEIQALETEINNIVALNISTNYYTIAQADILYAAKENIITAGTNSQWITGDKQLKNAVTDNVQEGVNLYHTEERVRLTDLAGYTPQNTTTTDADNILSALEKKADRVDHYTITETDDAITNALQAYTPSDGTATSFSYYGSGANSTIPSNSQTALEYFIFVDTENTLPIGQTTDRYEIQKDGLYFSLITVGLENNSNTDADVEVRLVTNAGLTFANVFRTIKANSKDHLTVSLLREFLTGNGIRPLLINSGSTSLELIQNDFFGYLPQTGTGAGVVSDIPSFSYFDANIPVNVPGSGASTIPSYFKFFDSENATNIGQTVDHYLVNVDGVYSFSVTLGLENTSVTDCEVEVQLITAPLAILLYSTKQTIRANSVQNITMNSMRILPAGREVRVQIINNGINSLSLVQDLFFGNFIRGAN